MLKKTKHEESTHFFIYICQLLWCIHVTFDLGIVLDYKVWGRYISNVYTEYKYGFCLRCRNTPLWLECVFFPFLSNEHRDGAQGSFVTELMSSQMTPCLYSALSRLKHIHTFACCLATQGNFVWTFCAGVKK